jgi:hypothetical protein
LWVQPQLLSREDDQQRLAATLEMPDQALLRVAPHDESYDRDWARMERTSRRPSAPSALRPRREVYSLSIGALCRAHNIRLFNDAANVVLSYASDRVTLAEIAPDYPDLSWAKAFTVAKLIGNGTGWHVGAMVGSPDFITVRYGGQLAPPPLAAPNVLSRRV